LDNQKGFVYPDDFPLLEADLKLLLSGEKAEHEMQYRWMGRSGIPIWIVCKGRVVLNEEGCPGLMLGCINEIGRKQKADNISGLLGASSLQEHLTQLGRLTEGFVMRIGIDDFRFINERLGVEYGDTVLRQVAQCIENSLLPGQYVYRVISDEFLIMDLSGAAFEEIKELYYSIRLNVERVIARRNYEAVYTISGGVVDIQDMQESNYEEIMRLSEFALGQAKRMGKNQVYMFTHTDYAAFLRTRAISRSLRKAVSNDFAGLDLYFQPLVYTQSEELYGAEALLRYQMPDGERISPIEFIPILEESGLILPVGKWIIRKAADMCRICRKKYPDFRISINLSYIQLTKSPVFMEVMDALKETQLPPDALIMELTESGYLENSINVQKVWNRFKEAGVQIALDDFGTGYSNLQNIARFSPDIVKIDRSFTLKALQNSYERQLLSHIINMVHSINLRIVIEGIEEREEQQQIMLLGSDFIQGYYYSKPCPREEFLRKYQVVE
ncbi:MAG: GGDEF and EAL domain-containing protein, partial [Acetatifactor sp.]|nr:GGDEF and EAL domain-containing protein [Acetatifactor sp.]